MDPIWRDVNLLDEWISVFNRNNLNEIEEFLKKYPCANFVITDHGGTAMNVILRSETFDFDIANLLIKYRYDFDLEDPNFRSVSFYPNAPAPLFKFYNTIIPGKVSHKYMTDHIARQLLEFCIDCSPMYNSIIAKELEKLVNTCARAMIFSKVGKYNIMRNTFLYFKDEKSSQIEYPHSLRITIYKSYKTCQFVKAIYYIQRSEGKNILNCRHIMDDIYRIFIDSP